MQFLTARVDLARFVQLANQLNSLSSRQQLSIPNKYKPSSTHVLFATTRGCWLGWPSVLHLLAWQQINGQRATLFSAAWSMLILVTSFKLLTRNARKLVINLWMLPLRHLPPARKGHNHKFPRTIAIPPGLIIGGEGIVGTSVVDWINQGLWDGRKYIL